MNSVLKKIKDFMPSTTLSGRDPNEKNRAATSTELLIDLIYVVGFSIITENLVEMVNERLFLKGILTFSLVMFALCLSWVNYLWFFSAFDTEDWFTYIVALVQVIGILIIITGIGPVFHGMRHYELQLSQFIIGYVVLRAGLVISWTKVAIDSKVHRKYAVKIAATLFSVQVLWVLTVLIFPLSWYTFVFVVILEIFSPIIIRDLDFSIPIHIDHLAERFSLLFIISLGEILAGSAHSFISIYSKEGMSFNGILLILFGASLMFSIGRMYFSYEFGELLRESKNIHRTVLSFIYTHVLMLFSVTIIGTSMDLLVDGLIHDSEVTTFEIICFTVIPLNIFFILLDLLVYFSIGSDNFYRGRLKMNVLIQICYLLILFANYFLAASLVPFLVMAIILQILIILFADQKL